MTTRTDSPEKSPNILGQHAATVLPLPEYFDAKGMLRDPEWVEAYISAVLQWPKGCALGTQDRQLVGLAKSLAFSWEPGILNHTDLALKSGSSPEEVTEILRTTAIVVGLASLERAVRGLAMGRPGRESAALLKPLQEYYGRIPRLFRHRVILEDAEWLHTLLKVSGPAFDSRHGVIHPRLRALVCLAAASVIGWEDGVRLYVTAARRFGATAGEVADVTKSVFKTAVSNSMAAGFRTPCHIPRLEEYRTILSAYVSAGALGERGREPLSSRSA